MNLNPSQLEELVSQHFSALFNPNDTVLLAGGGLSETWLRCALTEKGKALLIETDSPNSPFTRQFPVPGRTFPGRIRVEEIQRNLHHQPVNFIAFYCRNERIIRLFCRLMADIIWHLCNEGPQTGDPWTYLQTRLEGWRMLFSGADNLAIEKGLIGELYLLRHLITRHNHPITIWDGPLGGTKDFRLPDQNIEVKTTSVRTGYLVEISGLFQTVSLQAREKLLFIRLEQTSNGPLSVRSLRDEILALTNETEELNRRLEDFPPELFESPNRWEVLEAVVMDIDARFPRISEHSFVNQQLPDGIVQIKWTADLSMLDKTRLMDANF